ncbi:MULTISPECIES: bifunctional riboflavin kinase/FAD synthetase [unclassified Schaalia]|uniref:bifunctional riboflavin kinase/FAD synthetase n=1 Tax=unclassified Schaalia TaxID=2691889 RepID=UPI001E42153D|nr:MULTISPECIES: bifunctional riboflavin kinase/FAD synthetase [unclassified Schaalia]MCD4549384.1 bifunctional riboflavin kinase/FAD synthetase [Schaalia sp. lx-260]MCD4557944.1 bifunctional riboflavin kinase/FAD synthetase [Schaalia sp. lx-100]
MEVWTDLSQVPAGISAVVTIGNFDGMHLGHKKVIATCVERARKRGVHSVALTFDPHPRKVHQPDSSMQLIEPLRDRLDAMAATGLDGTLVVHYDASVYVLSPQDFVKHYLVDALGVAEVVVGEDFRFGQGNSGTVDTLRALGRNDDFDVVMVTDIEAPEGRRWSSSWVRELLAIGDVSGAARVLGHLHRIRGTVEHGHKRGRELGFPTANLCSNIEGVVPGDGVYAGWLVRRVPDTYAAEFLPSAISVGTNPQFLGRERTVEAHVLGRSDLDLYGEDVAVTFVSRIRSMCTFDSVPTLLAQMDEDLRSTAAVLGIGVTGRVDPSQVTAGRF